jgi:hypothetical protein
MREQSISTGFESHSWVVLDRYLCIATTFTEMTAQVQYNNTSSHPVILGLGVNEVASSLLIAKHVGSVFSRTEDARLFHILESQFDVRVRFVPAWLKNSIMERTTPIHGEKMRIIPGFKAMQNVQITKLEGIASLVVLMARSIQSKDDITSLLGSLILGGMGSIVDAGNLQGPSLPYNLQPLLRSFVQSTLDCDSNSPQRNRCRLYLAALAMHVGPSTNSINLKRRKNTVLQAISEILGGASIVEELERQRSQSERHSESFRPPEDEIRVHNTVDMTSAYIALAARANGADCAVDIMLGDGKCERVPETYENTLNTFVVRLWACQPPPEIAGILRYTSTLETTTYADEEFQDEEDSNDGLTVFGGALEVSSWVARKVGYNGSRLPKRQQQLAAAFLWEKGYKIAEKCPWSVKEASRWSYPVRFRLNTTAIETGIDPAVAGLVKAFRNKHDQMFSVSPALAMAVHDLYGYTDYIQDDDSDEEWIAAMMVVAIALAVKSLQHTTHLPDTAPSDSSRFAFNLSTIKPSGGIHQILFQAFTPEGVRHQRLLWAAATVWGGASFRTQGNTLVDDSVMGIKAPECTVLLDLLRDPLTFIQHGISNKLFRVCYGAVPMLPRDPKSGFLKALGSAALDAHPVISTASPRFPISFSRTQQRTPVNGAKTTKISCKARDESHPDLVITFEPVIADPSRGLFCAWYMGNLAFEISPSAVFCNTLKRTLDNWQPGFKAPRRIDRPLEFKDVTQRDLLTSTEIVVEDACGVFHCHSQPGWAIAVTGLADVRVVFCKEAPLSEHDLEDKLEEQDVVLILHT